jgi:hypothetical protein
LYRLFVKRGDDNDKECSANRRYSGILDTIKLKMKLNYRSDTVLSITRFLSLGFLALALAGCGGDEIKVYKVAKDTVPVSDSPPKLRWTTPVGWEEKIPSDMRVASFAISQGAQKADVSVVPLPGFAGGELPNVNRWRGQVGLGPVEEGELVKLAETVQLAGDSARLYDFTGKSKDTGAPTRILSAVQHRSEVAWFFKMTGDDALVQKEKPVFIEFLKTVRFAAAGPTVLPASHPAEGKPDWQVPPGWQEVSGGEFLFAKFMIPGEGAPTAVNVSRSAGQGGGLAGNANRWRGQLGLAPWTESELTAAVKSVEASGVKASMVDMSGTDARSGLPARLVGMMVPLADQTWFYKLMGDPKTVAAQQEAFQKFVQSVKY